MQTLVAMTIAALGAVAVAVSVRRVGGESPARPAALAALRLAALAALIAALIGPTTESRESLAIPSRLAILIDTSQSMSLPADDARGKRLDVAYESARAFADAATAGGTPPVVTWLGADSVLRPVSSAKPPQATGRATDIRAWLDEISADDSPAAVLVSDGADNLGARASELIPALRTAGLRVSALGVGEDRPPRDIAVDRLTAPRRVRANARFKMTALIRTRGFAGEEIKAQVMRDESVVRALPIGADAANRPVEISLRAGAPGRYRYTVKVAPRADELSSANNTRSVLIQVVPARPQVVLIAGAPSMEYAFLRRFLLSSKELKARIVVRKVEPAGFWTDHGKPAKTSIASAVDLKRARAVILQDAAPGGLGGLVAKLPGFVREGGGLAVLGGAAAFNDGSSSLRSILPVQPGVEYVDELVQPELARAGGVLTRALAEGPIPLASLPFLRGRNLATSVKPGAEVAMTGNGDPLLITRQIGRGRVIALLSDSTHRWVFHADATDDGQAAFDAFWGTLIDWLTEVRDDRPVVAEFDRESYQAGAPARLLVQVTDADHQPVTGATVTAEVQIGEGRPRRIICAPAPGSPGRYETTLVAEAPGAIHAKVAAAHRGRRLGTNEAEASVQAAAVELVDGRPNPALLQAIAKGSGGRYATIEHAAELGRVRPPEATLVTRLVRKSVAREPWILALLLALWTLDWSLRRRWRG